MECTPSNGNVSLAIHTLRVNIKSLAAEARIIREEARRAPWCAAELNRHRRGLLRHQARIAQLALGYLRGRPYRRLEAKTNEPVNDASLAIKLSRALGVDVGSITAAICGWLQTQ